MFEIQAFLRNGIMLFGGTMPFVPHKGEEIEYMNHVFVVESVKYQINPGQSFKNHVRLQLQTLE